MNAAARSVRPNFIGMSSSELSDLVDFYQQRFEEQAVLDGYRPVNLPDYLSPFTPVGYETPMAYLAKNDPMVLSLMDDLPEAFDEDHKQLNRECLRLNMRRVEVPAPAWLTRQGIFTCWSYPVKVLQKHFQL